MIPRLPLQTTTGFTPASVSRGFNLLHLRRGRISVANWDTYMSCSLGLALSESEFPLQVQVPAKWGSLPPASGRRLWLLSVMRYTELWCLSGVQVRASPIFRPAVTTSSCRPHR